jgi:hypothetical protein
VLLTLLAVLLIVQLNIISLLLIKAQAFSIKESNYYGNDNIFYNDEGAMRSMVIVFLVDHF